ncbi:MAG: trimethylamine methyltransferase family protein, partial [Dinoroseobacter sp.]|nr:trimethylamine methyltransferase family protein [Dinoroseobacter sp.]
TYRMLRGVEVNEETLGFDTICEAVLGEGHFLGGQHTYKAMERDHFYPPLADREEPRTWAEAGSREAWDRAKEKAQNILAEHTPEYLTRAQDREIRDRFKIL